MFLNMDYHPLMYGRNHKALDQQIQLAPHLVQTPNLVNSLGMLHPINMQSLGRGRENGKVSAFGMLSPDVSRLAFNPKSNNLDVFSELAYQQERQNAAAWASAYPSHFNRFKKQRRTNGPQTSARRPRRNDNQKRGEEIKIK